MIFGFLRRNGAFMSIVWTILILGIMIFIHELGHFLAARMYGVRVIEFALGMGPRIIKWGKGETVYSIRLFPIGGFCQMEGEDEASDDPRALSNIAAGKRFVIMVAGAAMNVLLALVFYLIVAGSFQKVQLPEVAASQNPALLPGDKIVRMDNTGINIRKDIDFFMFMNGEKDVEVTVLRDGEKLVQTITPTLVEDQGVSRYILGITPVEKDNNLGLTLREGFYETIFGVKYIYLSLWQMVTGQVSLADVSGPVGIVSIVGEVAESAAPAGFGAVLLNLLSLAALIGVNLGVVNLLPLPALDGGRVVFLIIEMIRKKPINPNVEGYIHFAGLVLLLLFMVVITFSDVFKLFG